ENQAARQSQALADVERNRLLLDLTFAAEKVDANHRSIAFRRARPTATAADGAMSAGSPPSFFASQVTARNGSKSSTGALKRSCTIWWKPSTRDAPPLNMIRSISSVHALALKKPKVLWISSSTFS